MKNKLIIILSMLLIVLLSSLAFAAAKTTAKKTAPRPAAATAKPVSTPKPIEWAAKVNSDTISMDLYNKRLEAAIKDITKELSIEAAEEKGILKAARKAILEQMIEAVILMQWGEREGIEIKEKSIKTRIQELKKSFPTPSEFHKSLAEQGMTLKDLEWDIKKQLVTDKLITMREKTLAVTDEEMKAFYDKNMDLYVQREKLHLKQVFAHDKRDIDSARSKLDKGEAFSGEDIGLVEKGQAPVYDDSSLFSLKTGRTSEILSGEAGYYIFNVEGRTPAREAKFKDVKDNIRKFLLKEKARTQFLKDLQEEKTNARIILNEKLEKLF